MTRIVALTPSALAEKIRRQIVDIEADIESMRSAYHRIGERSDWEHPSLLRRYEDLCFWEDRVAELRRERKRLLAVNNSAADTTDSPPAA